MSYFITTKTSAHADGSLYRVLDVAEKRDVARARAAELGGTVRSQEELDKLIAAKRVDKTTLPGYVAPEKVGRWTDLAASIAKEPAKRNTVGKKAREPKRVETDPAVLDAAVKFADGIQAEVNKVGLVRALAAWTHTDGTTLQRRDAFKVVRSVAAGANIADHTISTQWQLVRSGKLEG